MGAPVAASAEMVRAALGVGGEEVCRAMVRELRGGDRVAAERGARGLKKVAEARAEALYGLRKEVFREAMRGRVMGVARRFAETGTAAMRARARRLLGLRPRVRLGEFEHPPGSTMKLSKPGAPSLASLEIVG